jgi:uncharacterized protein (DUF1778 family)
MGMNLRLTEERRDALDEQAKHEGRSMQQVTVSAIDEYLQRHRRNEHIEQLGKIEAERFASLLERLSD